ERYMFTGRLSLRAQPWLADHAVAGVVLLPGAAFLEMVVRAAGAAGCGRVPEFAVWPRAGAVPVETGDMYEGMAAAGYGYGPVFRGLRAAWRRGPDIFAEVALPPEAAGSAGSFGVHPALLDAALHPAVLAGDAGPAGAGTAGGYRAGGGAG